MWPGPALRLRLRRPWASAAEGRAPLLSGESLARRSELEGCGLRMAAAAAAQGRVTPNGGGGGVGVCSYGPPAGGPTLAGACGEIGRSGKAVWWSRRERKRRERERRKETGGCGDFNARLRLTARWRRGCSGARELRNLSARRGPTGQRRELASRHVRTGIRRG